jgi:hypothetical protein
VTPVRLDQRRAAGTVDPWLWGGLAQHVARGICWAISGAGSQFGDHCSFRTDVLELLRALRLSVRRWRRGNFTPKAGRSVRVQFPWGGTDRDRFGTDNSIELLRYSRRRVDVSPDLRPVEPIRWSTDPRRPRGQSRALSPKWLRYAILRAEVASVVVGGTDEADASGERIMSASHKRMSRLPRPSLALVEVEGKGA